MDEAGSRGSIPAFRDTISAQSCDSLPSAGAGRPSAPMFNKGFTSMSRARLFQLRAAVDEAAHLLTGMHLTEAEAADANEAIARLWKITGQDPIDLKIGAGAGAHSGGANGLGGGHDVLQPLMKHLRWGGSTASVNSSQRRLASNTHAEVVLKTNLNLSSDAMKTWVNDMALEMPSTYQAECTRRRSGKTTSRAPSNWQRSFSTNTLSPAAPSSAAVESRLDFAFADKLPYRPLANILRKLVADQPLSEQLQRCVPPCELMRSWNDFNIVKVAQSSKAPLVVTMVAACRTLGLVTELGLSESKLVNYARVLEALYRNNPYHNSTHAADMLQAMVAMVSKDALTAALSPTMRLAMVLACGAHDVGHPGVNNKFLADNSDPICLMMPKSSAEQMSLSLARCVLAFDACDVLSDLEPEAAADVQTSLSEIIMHTDMARHLLVMEATEPLARRLHALGTSTSSQTSASSSSKTRVSFGVATDGRSSRNLNALEGSLEASDALSLACLLVHCADISSCARPAPLAGAWGSVVYKEFHLQSDLEERVGLPVTQFFQRSVVICKAQVGFINAFVRPVFDAVKLLCPEAVAPALLNIDANIQLWDALSAAGAGAHDVIGQEGDAAPLEITSHGGAGIRPAGAEHGRTLLPLMDLYAALMAHRVPDTPPAVPSIPSDPATPRRNTGPSDALLQTIIERGSSSCSGYDGSDGDDAGPDSDIIGSSPTVKSHSFPTRLSVGARTRSGSFQPAPPAKGRRSSANNKLVDSGVWASQLDEAASLGLQLQPSISIHNDNRRWNSSFRASVLGSGQPSTSGLDRAQEDMNAPMPVLGCESGSYMRQQQRGSMHSMVRASLLAAHLEVGMIKTDSRSKDLFPGDEYDHYEDEDEEDDD